MILTEHQLTHSTITIRNLVFCASQNDEKYTREVNHVVRVSFTHISGETPLVSLVNAIHLNGEAASEGWQYVLQCTTGGFHLQIREPGVCSGT